MLFSEVRKKKGLDIMGKRTRKVAIVVLAIVAISLVACATAKNRWDAHYYDGYDAALPLSVEVRATEDREGYQRIAFQFDGLAGQLVPSVLALPAEASGPFPCIIFLHGIGQEKEFIDEIIGPFVEAGYAMVTFDQYTRGERKLEEEGMIKEMQGLRRRAALNVIETRRLVDYLLTRPDVDPERIYLLGASFGAITGSTAAAFEERIHAVVLCYGGGNLRALLSSDEAKSEAGRWHWLIREAGAFIMAPSDPVRHVAEISPRPLLIQNGTHDRLISNEAAKALQEAAGEPKEIVWYDSDHIGLDEDHVWRVLGDSIEWLDGIKDEG